ncbi:hypothetical protein MLD38_030446 [Melastoma candidum]|uniref:Uncharacterized protein n=1 Tax=Melastoma candidum TaxID=119954 RepID=A0ACB9MLR5_9MYRT|nr:hypothetical protein MLD38_030446 [Melastoma candidum]
MGAMLLIQAINTGAQLLAKVTFNHGTFVFSLLTYRHVVAALCIAPFALYFERGSWKRPGLLAWVLLFFSALTGITLGVGLCYYGIRDTTATYSASFGNLIPIVTFVLSVIARMETLDLKTTPGKVKVIGALLCIAGTVVTALYKGFSFHVGDRRPSMSTSDGGTTHLARGTVMLVLSSLSYGSWYILQAKLLRVFPLKYFVAFLTCAIAAVQSAIVGVCIDRDPDSWKLGWNLQLTTIVYMGVLATAATLCIFNWVIARKGPAYPSMFGPLTLIFVGILEAFILGNAITLGMLLGTVLILVGIYSFLWGKRNQMDGSQLTTKSETCTAKTSSKVADDNVIINISTLEGVYEESTSDETLPTEIVKSERNA